jgi:hypothetical protein
MRFRLREKDGNGNPVGVHLMGKVVNGRFSRRVMPGEIVESNEPLDQLFKNKFEKLDGDVPEPTKPSKPVHEDDPIEQRVKAVRSVAEAVSAGPKGKGQSRK